MFKSFASDNNAPIHPKILKAIANANKGNCLGYGYDAHTQQAKKKFQELFGQDIEVVFVLTGTAANILSLTTMLQPFEAIITAKSAHINIDECGAPEKFTGCKIVTLPQKCGKINPKLIEKILIGIGDEHHVQPKVISITQSTELGCVYTKKEIEEITSFAHKNNLLVHMDGSRISNAAVKLGMEFREFTKDAGIDVLSFGGTKNGLMIGEAVVFFNKNLTRYVKFLHKQTMQLYSKMRFISAQFTEYLSNNLWLKNAQNANNMAKFLELRLKTIKEIKILYPVEANEVFAIIPKKAIIKIQQHSFFYVIDENKNVVRWVTSFNTTKKDIERFIKLIKSSIKNDNKIK